MSPPPLYRLLSDKLSTLRVVALAASCSVRICSSSSSSDVASSSLRLSSYPSASSPHLREDVSSPIHRPLSHSDKTSVLALLIRLFNPPTTADRHVARRMPCCCSSSSSLTPAATTALRSSSSSCNSCLPRCSSSLLCWSAAVSAVCSPEVVGTSCAPPSCSRRPFSSWRGASRFRWPAPAACGYVRKDRSDFWHYPGVSHANSDGLKYRLDWRYSDPTSGYEGSLVYGPNCLLVSNLPFGKTPEYLQERLRRFFSRFGMVEACRVIPHALDNYQASGVGFVSFRSRRAVEKALKAPLKFPGSLHYKTVQMRDLLTDKTNDVDFTRKALHVNRQLLSIACQLYSRILKTGEPVPLSRAWEGLFERQYMPRRLGSPGDDDDDYYHHRHRHQDGQEEEEEPTRLDEEEDPTKLQTRLTRRRPVGEGEEETQDSFSKLLSLGHVGIVSMNYSVKRSLLRTRGKQWWTQTSHTQQRSHSCPSFSNAPIRTADESVSDRFGSWEMFLSSEGFRDLFVLHEEQTNLDASERSDARDERHTASGREEAEKDPSASWSERSRRVREERTIEPRRDRNTHGTDDSLNDTHRPRQTSVERKEETQQNKEPWERTIRDSFGHLTPRRPSPRRVLVNIALLSEEELQRVLFKCGIALSTQLQEQMSVDWREGKPELPDYVLHEIRLGKHADKLPETLQLQSRTRLLFKRFDERHLLKLRLRQQQRKQKKEIRRNHHLQHLKTTTPVIGEDGGGGGRR